MSIRRSLRSTVFPTLVGVFLMCACLSSKNCCLPHARGGVSASWSHERHPAPSSPRSWGCFLRPSASCCPIPVFPTLVGVFLMSSVVRRQGGRLPHARGGVSSSWPLRSWARPSSPRSWGCFSERTRRQLPPEVFPTLVGVFPVPYLAEPNRARLPHARGGVSLPAPRMTQRRKSSPRSWGCCQDSLLHGGLSVRSGSYSMSCVLIQKR